MRSVAAGMALTKKPDRVVWLSKMVGLPGVEPGTNGLCVPLQFSLPLSGLWSGLSLTFRLARTVSTPSLITQGLARDYHAKAEASPNLSDSTKEQSELTPRQPIPSLPCPEGFRL
jgi:hypothetical protein